MPGQNVELQSVKGSECIMSNDFKLLFNFGRNVAKEELGLFEMGLGSLYKRLIKSTFLIITPK